MRKAECTGFAYFQILETLKQPHEHKRLPKSSPKQGFPCRRGANMSRRGSSPACPARDDAGNRSYNEAEIAHLNVLRCLRGAWLLPAAQGETTLHDRRELMLQSQVRMHQFVKIKSCLRFLDHRSRSYDTCCAGSSSRSHNLRVQGGGRKRGGMRQRKNWRNLARLPFTLKFHHEKSPHICFSVKMGLQGEGFRVKI